MVIQRPSRYRFLYALTINTLWIKKGLCIIHKKKNVFKKKGLFLIPTNISTLLREKIKFMLSWAILRSAATRLDYLHKKSLINGIQHFFRTVVKSHLDEIWVRFISTNAQRRLRISLSLDNVISFCHYFCARTQVAKQIIVLARSTISDNLWMLWPRADGVLLSGVRKGEAKGEMFLCIFPHSYHSSFCYRCQIVQKQRLLCHCFGLRSVGYITPPQILRDW